MASPKSPRGRQRGTIGWLPSGSARVKVYAGIDQLTGKKLWLRETVPARATKRETEREAEKVVTRLLNQIDERRSPRTETTVNQLLDRWLEVIDIERKTRAGYVSKIEKHVRLTIGRLPVGRVRAETIESLYSQLRRCRDHCRGEKFTQHRTAGEHACDEHSARRRCARAGDPAAVCQWRDRACKPHSCTPLGRWQHPRRPCHPQRRFHTGRSLGLDRCQSGRADRAAVDAQTQPLAPNACRGRHNPQRGLEGPGLGNAHPLRDDDGRTTR